jgi:hypothetical protein
LLRLECDRDPQPITRRVVATTTVGTPRPPCVIVARPRPLLLQGSRYQPIARVHRSVSCFGLFGVVTNAFTFLASVTIQAIVIVGRRLGRMQTQFQRGRFQYAEQLGNHKVFDGSGHNSIKRLFGQGRGVLVADVVRLVVRSTIPDGEPTTAGATPDQSGQHRRPYSGPRNLDHA